MLCTSRFLQLRYSVSSTGSRNRLLCSSGRNHFFSTGASNNKSLSQSQIASTASTLQVNNERSKAEIQTLVRRRVQERDGWKIDGHVRAPLALRDVLKFMTQHLPDIMAFRPPSQEWLDEHFPVLPMDWDQLQNPHPDKIQMTWLGHSSLLVQMDGCNILTDPVFRNRCSPSQWFGPQRYRPPPCTIEELCDKLNSKLDVVLISHNHYDHLDHATVQTISQLSPTTTFVVPLGVRTWFRDHVSTDISIYETDWHEGIECKYHTTNSSSETEGRSLHIQCLPMRHWSNRTGDRDQTLWCGYSLTTSGSPSGTTVDSSTRDEGGPSSSARNTHSKKVLFPGDTAWFDDLAEIGTTYGPFDVAAIPIGAYEPHDFMKTNHINVMEAVRMKDAVQAKAAVPIHWGTFPVTIEPVMEPREKLVECMKDRPDAETFTPWQIGETKLFD